MRFLINSDPELYYYIIVIIMIIQVEIFLLYANQNKDVCTLINIIRSVIPVALFMYILLYIIY